MQITIGARRRPAGALGVALVMALATAGCLSEPEALDCAEAPGAAGCPDAGGIDGGVGPDVQPGDAAPEVDFGVDGRVPADVAPPRPEVGPIDRGAPGDDGVEPDMLPPPACEATACPEAPIAGACFDDRAVRLGPPDCVPATCSAAEPDCDPELLACRATVGCLLWCLVAGDRQSCEEVCAEAHLGGDAGALARFEALNACLNDADCPDGPRAAACQLDACPDALAGCVGGIDRVWFVRPPFIQGPVRCDYPLEPGDDCGEAGQTCRQGDCVDAEDPCDPSPCLDRPPLRCDDNAVVESAPPVCRVEGGAAVCDYDEQRRPCEPEPARCAGDVLIETEASRCVDDEQGVYCQPEQTSTDCAVGAAAVRCEVNDIVETAAGRCVDGGGQARCEPPVEQRSECERGLLCHRGECVRSTCAVGCADRNVRGCDAQQAEILVRCSREQRCVEASCQPIPDVHGNPCRDPVTTAACAEAGLFCRGFAAVPICLLGETPRSGRQGCWTSQDCELGNICTRSGRCTSGEAGSPCEDPLDCQGGRFCSRGTCL